MTKQTFQQGDIIFRKGDVSNDVYRIISGGVRIISGLGPHRSFAGISLCHSRSRYRLRG